MILTYTTTREGLARGLAHHYKRRTLVPHFVRVISGSLMIILGINIFLASEPSRPPVLGAALVALGIFGLLRRHIWIRRSLKGTFAGRSAADFQMQIETSDEGISMKGSAAESFIEWSQFVDLKCYDDGILLYPQKNIFHWIPADCAFVEGNWEGFTESLKRHVVVKV